MFSLKFSFVDELYRVAQAAEKEQYYALRRAAFRVYETSRESIKQAAGPSPPGTPPHTHTQGTVKSRRSKRFGMKRYGVLPRSIKYDVDRSLLEAIIGPTAIDAGLAGFVHEFGGDRPDTFPVENYPMRPFMSPAMEAELDNFAGEFAGSIGE